jgi:hypothetical protein
LPNIYEDDKIKDSIMIEACGTQGKEEKYIRNVAKKNLKETNHLEYLGTDGRISK